MRKDAVRQARIYKVASVGSVSNEFGGEYNKEFRESEWVDATTAAKMIGKSRPQITHYAKSGQITFIRRYGRLFVSRAELAVFVPRPTGYPGHKALMAERAKRLP